MKIFGFHLMPYQGLPQEHLDSDDSSWVTLSNAVFDPVAGHKLYERYLAELVAFDRAGFDGICVNEHHQTAYGLMPSPDVVAALLVPQTSCTIAILGNAAICGVFSTASDRYQSRMAWLAPFCVGLAAFGASAGKRETSPRQEDATNVQA